MARKDKKAGAAPAFVLRLGLAFEPLAATSGLAQVKWCASDMNAWEERGRAGLLSFRSHDLAYGSDPFSGRGGVC